MEGDRADDCRCEAPALLRPCGWRPYSLRCTHYARAGEPPLALPHLYPIFPALIYMRALESCSQVLRVLVSSSITVLAALEQLTSVFMTQRARDMTRVSEPWVPRPWHVRR
jgi:hypothetical protein